MIQPRDMSSRLAPVAIALAILAVVVRVMIPQGFMGAQPGHAGASPVVLCSADGLRRAYVDADGGLVGAPIDHQAPAPDHHECVFALAGALLGPAFGAQTSAPLAAMPLELGPALAAQTPGRGLSAPPPPQTGPPITV